ncbi:UdgX family uracil-DNA binding protein [Ottowia sp.]|uniref:UdgX family uracil-DNA binding protein n=1 Tax=Ottowia sp. TaxID=1898956 RepID=UPI002CB94828|nr:UdgX family uracil-DNA binding protein [Ottowia sp.]HOB66044.1 UdgX family uracil-DNA binding protein [Ottowia sp.]HPZ56056.1 UdgX family uracil-DNA binding protein [Ottowia sp.]HQD49107.1 UdgX family uracil-DNA binding protein [Ottowia sp.]
MAVTPAFTRFRQRARALLADGVPPADAIGAWHGAGTSHRGSAPLAADLFAGAGLPPGAESSTPVSRATRPRAGAAPLVPSAFLALARRVVLHSAPGRFDALYALLWRLVHEPGLRHDPLDAEWLRLRQMARAVQRDAYKMRAFVRFRPVRDDAAPDTNAHNGADTLHVAWFEPEHDVLEAVAPWFARRFASMRWAILTPRQSVRWSPSSQRLQFGPGAERAQAPAADDGEALWLTYYRHIFNPARLNLPLMRQHMPRKYWANLPEAAAISELAAGAAARTATMLAASEGASPPAHLLDQELVALDGQAPEPHLALKTPTPPQSSGLRPSAADTPALAPRHTSLAALHAAVQACAACPIGVCATQAVNGNGPLGARLMLVGEQPGDQEDLAGQPFVGPAGRLLDQALARAGLNRGELFLTNAVRHFKHELRGKRRLHKTPGQREAAACLPWLLREIDLVQPAALLALGATAARALLGPGVTLAQSRGRWRPGPGGRPVFVTWHPAALLRLPERERARVWALWLDDLRAAAQGPQAADPGVADAVNHPMASGSGVLA